MVRDATVRKRLLNGRSMYTEKQKKGLEGFCANSYWKRIFDGAPSEKAKEYYAEYFAYGSNLSRGREHTDIVIGIFRILSAADWDYIIENCHSSMGRWGLKHCRAKYGKESRS